MSYTCTTNPSPKDIEDFLTLRKQIYLEAMNVQIPYTDNWDQHCIPLVVKRGDNVIAGARLILSSLTVSLPIEDESIDLNRHFILAELGKYAELSRFMVHPEHRNGQVSLAIFSAIEKICIERNIQQLVFFAGNKVARLYGLTLNRLNKLSHRSHQMDIVRSFDVPQSIADTYRGIVDCIGMITVDCSEVAQVA